MPKSASAPPRGKRGRNITWHPVDEAAGGSEKRNRILQAAIAIFARDGYFPAHISDIAARADVADGTVYLYFKNKEQILMAVIDSAFIPFMQAARADFAELDPRERLHRLAVLHLETLGKNRELAMKPMIIRTIQGSPGLRQSAGSNWRPPQAAPRAIFFLLTA